MARKSMDNGQQTDLVAGRQLAMDVAHYQNLAGACSGRTSIAQVCSDTTLRHLVPQLRTHSPVEPIDSLGVHIPALSPQKNVNPSIAIADASLAKLFDLELKVGLLSRAETCSDRSDRLILRASQTLRIEAFQAALSSLANKRLGQAAKLLQNILKHRFVQAQVSNNPFELGILLFELTQPFHLRRHQAGIMIYASC